MHPSEIFLSAYKSAGKTTSKFLESSSSLSIIIYVRHFSCTTQENFYRRRLRLKLNWVPLPSFFGYLPDWRYSLLSEPLEGCFFVFDRRRKPVPGINARHRRQLRQARKGSFHFFFRTAQIRSPNRLVK